MTFSIGNSAINEEKIKAKKYDQKNNKLISFIETKDITLKGVADILKGENITLTFSKIDEKRGIEVVTIMQDKGLDLKEDMKSGEYFTIKEFNSNNQEGLYSTILETKGNQKFLLLETGEEIEIKKSGVFYDTKSKLIVSNGLFEELYSFGASDRDITKIFFVELLIIAGLSTILALLMQYILVVITGGYISTISIRLTPYNFIYSLVLAITTSYISSLPALKYLKRIQPADMLREE